jgi:hypothetical protein
VLIQQELFSLSLVHKPRLMKKILLILILFFISCTITMSQPGWPYMMPIQVTENSGSTLYNYQLSVTINTQALITAGQMDANGNDIRFKSNCAGGNLNYWIESGINTASTVIWVRIDTLAASSSKTIFMSYGNPSAAAASTLAIFNGPNSATDSVNITNPGGVGDSQRGFRFAPTEDILVTSFGKNEPNGTTRFVTLFDFNTQAVVRQTQVSGPTGIYSYASLSNPVWLTQNTQYVLELFQGTSDGYYYQTSSQIGQHLVYFDMRYCNGCTENTFPTNVLTNYHYGLPDLWYYTKSNVTPAPTYTVGTAVQPLAVTAYPDTFTCVNGYFFLNCLASNGLMPYAYSWTPSANVVNPTLAMTLSNPQDTTTYYITVTDSLGCMSSDSMTVFTFPLPAVSFFMNLDTICIADQPIALTGGNPAGGNYNGAGVYGDTLYPDSAGAGIHAVNYTYTDSLGCSNSSADSIFVDLCLGIEDLFAENFFIYPNPAGNELRIENAQWIIKRIEIFDVPGQIIFSQRLQANSQKQSTIDVSKLKPGIYFLQVEIPDRTMIRKFIKE